MNYLPRLESNCNPSNLCLPSSWDYRCAPLCLALCRAQKSPVGHPGGDTLGPSTRQARVPGGAEQSREMVKGDRGLRLEK
jgi:hypothetical protein